MLPVDVQNCVNSGYQDKARALKDISEVCEQYRSLTASLETINAPQGRHNIVKIGGTIPIVYKGNTYHLPVHTRVLPDYPTTAPITFLVPTSNMAVVPGHKHADQQGRCYFPYLSLWNRSSSTLLAFFKVACEAFSETPPLYSKPANANPPPVMQQQLQPQPMPQPAPVSPGGGYLPPGSGGGYVQPQPPGSGGYVPPPNINPAAAYPVNPPPSNPSPVPISEKFEQMVQEKEGSDEEDDAKFCVVCFSEPKEALVQPCCHISLCMKDALYMKNHGQPCPICRGKIDNVIRVFIA